MPKPSAPGADQPFGDDELRQLFRNFAEAPHVALAVSGGSDSTALLHLVARWAKLVDEPPQISVLTVDHGLRAESANEAAAVGKWAGDAGLAHHILVWEGHKPKTGIQAAARAERYRLMTGWCRTYHATWLLTAHTQDDQAETVLMRLARGTGIDGLAGIWQRTIDGGVSVFRPLLNQSRSRLRSVLAAVGQPWIEDPSNTMQQFERVRVRKIMPELAALGLTSSALARTAARALDASHALWGYADDFCKDHLQHFGAGYAEIDLSAFLNLPEETKRRVVVRLAYRYGGAHFDPVSLSGAERVVHIETWQQPARTFGGCKFVRRQRTLVVGRESGRIEPNPVIVTEAGDVVWDGKFRVSAPVGYGIVPLGIMPGIIRDPKLPKFVQDGLPAVLDVSGQAHIPHLEESAGIRAEFVAWQQS